MRRNDARGVVRRDAGKRPQVSTLRHHRGRSAFGERFAQLPAATLFKERINILEARAAKEGVALIAREFVPLAGRVAIIPFWKYLFPDFQW
jgi:hypothetical protein